MCVLVYIACSLVCMLVYIAGVYASVIAGVYASVIAGVC